MNSATAVDPIPQKISPHDLYLWPSNPRYAPLEDRSDPFDVSSVKDMKAQRSYVRRVKASDDDTARALKCSIEALGLLVNPMTPMISVCSLPDGGYVVIDGNARVMAIKELLADKAWCAAHQEYAEHLKAGILVMDLGAFSDRDVQIAAMKISAAHMGGWDDEDTGGECPSCELPWSGPGWCDSCAIPPGWHP